MGFLARFLTSFTLLALAAAPSFAQVGYTMEKGCTEVLSSDSPFKIVKPENGRDRLATEWGAAKLRGYLPANSIVELSDARVYDSRHSAFGYVGVKILSVPKDEATQVVRGQTRGGKDLGEANIETLVGSTGFVNRADLLPYVPGLLTKFAGAPGLDDAGSTVFVVRKGSPLFSIPSLEGKAVRLARTNSAYRMKRCCPNGPPQPSFMESTFGIMTGSPLFGGTKIETARAPGCTYAPIFEVLNGGTTLNPKVETTITSPCAKFTSLLQPAGEESLASAISTLSAPARVNEAFLTDLQNAEADVVNGKLCNMAGHCESGNHSKGLCRSGVRNVLARLKKLPAGWRPNPDPGLAAFNFVGKLEPYGFKRIPLRNPKLAGFDAANAPPGAVIIYSGGKAGHVEIKVNSHMYCSDYCTDHPRDASGGRTVAAIYLPPGI